jgi:hypothetical protein
MRTDAAGDVLSSERLAAPSVFMGSGFGLTAVPE